MNKQKRPIRFDRKAKSSHYLSKRLKSLGTSEFKRQTFYALENIRHGNLIAKVAGVALFVLIVTNAAAIFISTQPGLDPVASNVLAGFYFFSTLCFFVEYIARIWIADLAFGDCTRLQARLKYIFSPLGIIDLLSFAPSMISWFLPVTPALIHAIGVLRLVRFIKVTRYMRGFRTIGRVFRKHYHEIVAAFLVILLLIVVSSVVMYEIEHPAQPDKFNDLLSGLWWAMETVTSTGYGDIVPITTAGRVVGGLIMFLSLALVAIPGGIFSAGFVAEYQNANLRKIERDFDHDSKSDQHSEHLSTSKKLPHASDSDAVENKSETGNETEDESETGEESENASEIGDKTEDESETRDEIEGDYEIDEV